ncbi:hypothetical protein C7M84_017495 [Penaeus vannamei]|uniref:Uncharacterized protein n=1 Tax=Penaeus vannamei TaxID=6689 RepID=A0A3R7NR93_PENVA|nr:hypothetical protein C7M84_017495 [Penaeus vannamei]
MVLIVPPSSVAPGLASAPHQFDLGLESAPQSCILVLAISLFAPVLCLPPVHHAPGPAFRAVISLHLSQSARISCPVRLRARHQLHLFLASAPSSVALVLAIPSVHQLHLPCLPRRHQLPPGPCLPAAVISMRPVLPSAPSSVAPASFQSARISLHLALPSAPSSVAPVLCLPRRHQLHLVLAFRAVISCTWSLQSAPSSVASLVCNRASSVHGRLPAFISCTWSLQSAPSSVASGPCLLHPSAFRRHQLHLVLCLPRRHHLHASAFARPSFSWLPWSLPRASFSWHLSLCLPARHQVPPCLCNPRRFMRVHRSLPLPVAVCHHVYSPASFAFPASIELHPMSLHSAQYRAPDISCTLIIASAQRNQSAPPVLALRASIHSSPGPLSLPNLSVCTWSLPSVPLHNSTFLPSPRLISCTLGPLLPRPVLYACNLSFLRAVISCTWSFSHLPLAVIKLQPFLSAIPPVSKFPNLSFYGLPASFSCTWSLPPARHQVAPVHCLPTPVISAPGPCNRRLASVHLPLQSAPYIMIAYLSVANPAPSYQLHHFLASVPSQSFTLPSYAKISSPSSSSSAPRSLQSACHQLHLSCLRADHQCIAPVLAISHARQSVAPVFAIRPHQLHLAFAITRRVISANLVLLTLPLHEYTSSTMPHTGLTSPPSSVAPGSLQPPSSYHQLHWSFASAVISFHLFLAIRASSVAPGPCNPSVISYMTCPTLTALSSRTCVLASARHLDAHLGPLPYRTSCHQVHLSPCSAPLIAPVLLPRAVISYAPGPAFAPSSGMHLSFPRAVSFTAFAHPAPLSAPRSYIASAPDPSVHPVVPMQSAPSSSASGPCLSALSSLQILILDYRSRHQFQYLDPCSAPHHCNLSLPPLPGISCTLVLLTFPAPSSLHLVLCLPRRHHQLHLVLAIRGRHQLHYWSMPYPRRLSFQPVLCTPTVISVAPGPLLFHRAYRQLHFDLVLCLPRRHLVAPGSLAFPRSNQSLCHLSSAFRCTFYTVHLVPLPSPPSSQLHLSLPNIRADHHSPVLENPSTIRSVAPGPLPPSVPSVHYCSMPSLLITLHLSLVNHAVIQLSFSVPCNRASSLAFYTRFLAIPPSSVAPPAFRASSDASVPLQSALRHQAASGLGIRAVDQLHLVLAIPYASSVASVLGNSALDHHCTCSCNTAPYISHHVPLQSAASHSLTFRSCNRLTHQLHLVLAIPHRLPVMHLGTLQSRAVNTVAPVP